MILGLTNDTAGLLQGFLDAVKRKALSDGDFAIDLIKHHPQILHYK